MDRRPHTWVEPLYFFSLQLHLPCLLFMPTPMQVGLFWATYNHVSNVLSNYFNPKMNYFSTHEQTSPLNHPLPKLQKAEIPAPTRDWTLPLRRHKLFSYRHLTLRNILEPKESKRFQTSPCRDPQPSPWMTAIVESCKASELPSGPGWALVSPGFSRKPQHSSAIQAPSSVEWERGWGVVGVCFLSSGFIYPNNGLVSGGEERISGSVWVLKSTCQTLLSYLLGQQHTLLCNKLISRDFLFMEVQAWYLILAKCSLESNLAERIDD